MIQYPLDALSNSAGELKDTRKKQKEGGMIQRAFLTILGIMVGLLAVLFVVLVLLKGAIQKLFVRLCPKKAVAVATMALVLLPVATVGAEDTIARIENGNLIYYQKTKVIPGIVPKGITDEQARQLVEGVIHAVSTPKEEHEFYFGLPFAKKTDTFVLFRNGWIEDKKVGDKSLSVIPLIFLATIMVFGFVAGNGSASETATGLAIITTVLLSFLLLAVLSGDKLLLQLAGTIMSWLLVGTFLGWCLRKMKEKRQNAGHVSAKEHYGHA